MPDCFVTLKSLGIFETFLDGLKKRTDALTPDDLNTLMEVAQKSVKEIRRLREEWDESIDIVKKTAEVHATSAVKLRLLYSEQVAKSFLQYSRCSCEKQFCGHWDIAVKYVHKWESEIEDSEYDE